MKYDLIKQTMELLEVFELENHSGDYSNDIDGFKNWIVASSSASYEKKSEPDWVAKNDGRSPESVISTLLVHLNKYAKTYSKSVIHDSQFSTQEEFIYLINLKAFGAMSKTELIKMNIQDKPTGIQIINRLIKQGWVVQTDSTIDKRSKLIEISQNGLNELEKHMYKIRQATKIVSGNLSFNEKMQLIELLSKLTDFHQNIYSKNFETAELLLKVKQNHLPSIN